jgi:hypothetical protein
VRRCPALDRLPRRKEAFAVVTPDDDDAKPEQPPAPARAEGTPESEQAEGPVDREGQSPQDSPDAVGGEPAGAGAGDEILLSEKLHEYISNIVDACLSPKDHGLAGLAEDILARPDDILLLAQAAKARAMKLRRKFVTPEDIKVVARDILQDEIVLTRNAEEKKITADEVACRLLDGIEVP